jgi:hypothetical protein
LRHIPAGAVQCRPAAQTSLRGAALTRYGFGGPDVIRWPLRTVLMHHFDDGGGRCCGSGAWAFCKPSRRIGRLPKSIFRLGVSKKDRDHLKPSCATALPSGADVLQPKAQLRLGERRLGRACLDQSVPGCRPGAHTVRPITAVMPITRDFPNRRVRPQSGP